jgi:steroid delta-isomerase-like uncharacterized protein
MSTGRSHRRPRPETDWLRLTRRGAVSRFGIAGLGALAAMPVLRTAAQDATPAAELPAVVTEYVDAFETFDLERIMATHDENVVFEEIPTGTVIEGHDAVRAHYEAYAEAFSDITVQYANVFGAGSFAAGEWSFSARYTDDLEGFPPAEGQEFTVRGVDILELEGDRVTAIREYADLLGLLVQIGALPGFEEGEEATPAG